METKAAFEKWWKDEHGNLQDTGFIGQTIKMVAQQAWNSSRAAIEIELPKSGYYLGYESPEYTEVVDVIEAITSHGIRIKGETE